MEFTDGAETVTFNAPPDWPVPKGWTPSADWVPDPSWPPAPPGWQFWIPKAPAPESVDEVLTYPERPPVERSRQWWRLSKGAVFGIVTFAVVITIGLGFIFIIRPTGIRTMPVTRPMTPADNNPSPTWTDPGWGTTPLYIDFSAWKRFGGIDATFLDRGESVKLDTHDTTDTWRTKWSGLISPMTTTCAVRIVGRVRDISHTAGVAGGFGIGIGTLGSGGGDYTELTGTAFQFDFGLQGYRSAIYPSDTDHGVAPTSLDHQWHQIDVLMDSESQTLAVDGHTVATARSGVQCGQPFIRVWAGSAEFAEFTVTPLD